MRKEIWMHTQTNLSESLEKQEYTNPTIPHITLYSSYHPCTLNSFLFRNKSYFYSAACPFLRTTSTT